MGTRAEWIETPSGAMAWNSASPPMSACGIKTPIRARQPQPSACHIAMYSQQLPPQQTQGVEITLISVTAVDAIPRNTNPHSVTAAERGRHRPDPPLPSRLQADQFEDAEWRHRRRGDARQVLGR